MSSLGVWGVNTKPALAIYGDEEIRISKSRSGTCLGRVSTMPLDPIMGPGIIEPEGRQPSLLHWFSVWLSTRIFKSKAIKE